MVFGLHGKLSLDGRERWVCVVNSSGVPPLAGRGRTFDFAFARALRRAKRSLYGSLWGTTPYELPWMPLDTPITASLRLEVSYSTERGTGGRDLGTN